MIKVLVIDHHSDFLRTAAGYLSAGDTIGTCTAGSADEAVTRLKAEKIDVVVADIELQKEKGATLTDRLEEQGIDVPVVFYARHADEKAGIEAMRSGAELVLQLSGEPEGQFVELRSLIEEIVRRRQTEESLKRTVEDLRAIVTHNADAMLVLDRDGYIRFANPAAALLFNLPDNELIGKLFGFPIILREPVEMYVLREFRKFVAAEMRMVDITWRGQPSYLVSIRDITWHVRHEEELSQAKDRLEEEVQVKDKDLVEALQSLRTEVAERKRAEIALRESERKYRNIVDLSAEGIWVIDKNAIIRYVNPHMAELLDYGVEEMIGKPIYSFVDRSSAAVQKKTIERRKQGIRESHDIELVRKDGTKLLALVNGAPLFDDEGSYAGSVSMLTDITDRKRKEEELKEAKAQAELYLDLMGHDIRNLAQIAIGYLELARETDDPDEIKELLVRPLESLQDTAQIIDNVRKLQSADHIQEEARQVNLCEVLATLKAKYESVEPRRVTIDLKPGQGCKAMADSLIDDVFANLIGNAIKHSNPLQPLDISIRIDRFSEKGVEYLRTTVEDNGPGISNWVKDRIFMRFQRGDTRAHGKGLGLYIAKTLVEGYGGKIWVEDRVPGDYTQGARFVVVLPAAGA